MCVMMGFSFGLVIRVIGCWYILLVRVRFNFRVLLVDLIIVVLGVILFWVCVYLIMYSVGWFFIFLGLNFFSLV